MTKESQSFVDIVRQFASDLGLPKVDVDKLVETHRKNFEALTQTALVASEGVKSLAAKQKEMVESAFREALDMARNFKPSGDPQQILAKQSELARKAFDAAIDHTREIAEQVRKSNAEALKIASDRIVASIAELRASIEQGGDRSKAETEARRRPKQAKDLNVKSDRLRSERRGKVRAAHRSWQEWSLGLCQSNGRSSARGATRPPSIEI